MFLRRKFMKIKCISKSLISLIVAFALFLGAGIMASAFVLPAQPKVYARVSDLTDTTWVLNDELDLSRFMDGNEHNFNVGGQFTLFADEEWWEPFDFGPYNDKGGFIFDGTYGGGSGVIFQVMLDGIGTLDCYSTNYGWMEIGAAIFHFTSGSDLTNSDLIDWLYANAELQVEEPAQTGVVTDVIIPVVFAVVVGTIIAFVVMDSKKVFVK